MSVERIKRYKKTAALSFGDEQLEQAFQGMQDQRGRSSSVFSLLTLAVVNLVYAFLEHYILGLNSLIPFYSYLLLGLVSLVLAFFSWLNDFTGAMKWRTLIPGIVTIAVLISAVFFQQYRIYHGLEMALLMVWLGSLNAVSMRFSAAISIISAVAFTFSSQLFGASGLQMTGLVAMLLCAYVLSLSVSYILERFRRTSFLNDRSLAELYERQEAWAYTLIDLDLALSGIRDLKEMISRMMEYLKSAIEYESFVFTSLEGKGPKPEPDQSEGELFGNDDQTLWSDDLLNRLSQTRQALATSQFDTVRGFLGREKKNFLHFRLDIPVINDSDLMGVISLRRASEPFDELDQTAAVSISAQAMMIFKRTAKSAEAQMSSSLRKQMDHRPKAQEPVVVDSKPVAAASTPEPVVTRPDEKIEPVIDLDTKQVEVKPTQIDSPIATENTVDLDITGETTPTSLPDESSQSGSDETVVPKDVINKIRKDTEKARKTITLLSRENADQIAVDRYRTAAVEGEPLSILLVEVDGLASIREKDGDQAAYRVFAGIVKHIYSKTDRDRDVLGRYGQNGISVLLPRVDMNAAEKFAESIRANAEAASFKTIAGDRKATLSIGVAAITDETGNYDSMVKRADMALFVAKKNGRNCVKVRL